MINLVQKLKNIEALNRIDLDDKKVILILLISAVVIYIDFNFILFPQFKGLDKKRIEAVKLKKDLADFKKNSVNMQNMIAKSALTEQKQIPKAKKIISEAQFAYLLQDISRLANENEVSIIQIKPSHVAQSDNPKFNEYLIGLDLSGGYHNFGKFLNSLENLQAFVSAQEIKIAPLDDDYLKQKINMTLVTYVKK